MPNLSPAQSDINDVRTRLLNSSILLGCNQMALQLTKFHKGSRGIRIENGWRRSGKKDVGHAIYFDQNTFLQDHKYFKCRDSSQKAKLLYQPFSFNKIRTVIHQQHIITSDAQSVAVQTKYIQILLIHCASNGPKPPRLHQYSTDWVHLKQYAYSKA